MGGGFIIRIFHVASADEIEIALSIFRECAAWLAMIARIPAGQANLRS